MANEPVFTINGMSRYPGASLEVWERFLKWMEEVYLPIYMKVPRRRQIDYYKIVRESPLFPSFMSIFHYENLAGLDVAHNSSEYGPEHKIIAGELESWIKRRIMVFDWGAAYELVKSYRIEGSNSGEQPDTRIENAPVLHLEAYRITIGESEKYNRWFFEYCANVFIPLFMKQTGLKGYDYFRFNRISSNFPGRLETEYPIYLSAIYFKNIKDFENFEKSNELEVCKRTLRDIFPYGLKYEWYVQYELTRSYKK